MAKQRYIHDSFWTDPYIEKLDPSEKLLFLYYLTNPLCNIAGVYEIRNNRVAYETGFDKDMVEKIKSRFVKDKKMLVVDDWIVLANFAKHQSMNPNVKQGMQRIINELPQKVKALKGFESLSYFTLLNLTLPNGEDSGDYAPDTPILKAKKITSAKEYNFGEQMEQWKNGKAEQKVFHRFILWTKKSFMSELEQKQFSKNYFTQATIIKKYSFERLDKVFRAQDEASDYGKKYEWTLRTVAQQISNKKYE